MATNPGLRERKKHQTRLVIAETTEAMRTQVCSIYLVEEGGEALVLTATNGLSQEGVGNARLRLGEGVTVSALAREFETSRQTILRVRDARAAP